MMCGVVYCYTFYSGATERRQLPGALAKAEGWNGPNGGGWSSTDREFSGAQVQAKHYPPSFGRFLPSALACAPGNCLLSVAPLYNLAKSP